MKTFTKSILFIRICYLLQRSESFLCLVLTSVVYRKQNLLCSLGVGGTEIQHFITAATKLDPKFNNKRLLKSCFFVMYYMCRRIFIAIMLCIGQLRFLLTFRCIARRNKLSCWTPSKLVKFRLAIPFEKTYSKIFFS